MPGSTSCHGIGYMVFKGVIPPIPVFVKFASDRDSDLEINLNFLKNEANILQRLALLKVTISFYFRSHIIHPRHTHIPTLT